MSERMNQRQRDVVDEAVVELRALGAMAMSDPEVAHARADKLLLDLLDALHVRTSEVAQAYRELVEAAPWWAAA